MVERTVRLDIQGLRALAVALVVIFHLSPATLPGGYIGVDVFFVISGFLITAHLMREADRSGTIRLTEFWARRIRRLLPASLLVLAVSAVVVLIVLPQSTRQQNLMEILFAGVYVVNWNLAANSVDYLGSDTSYAIVQHYWSLSVEEQFYLVWPLLILAAIWAGRKALRIRVRTGVAFALTLILVVSLLLSVVETARSQPSAYFITTTRAWEFAAGGLVGFLPGWKLSEWARTASSWVAVAVIVVSAVRFNADTAFPGWVAVVPVAATAWLLHVGDVGSSSSPQYLARAGWVQTLGDLSYSLYLWHWPLIVGFVAVKGQPPGVNSMVALAVIAVVLAAITKRFVEDPVRRTTGMLRRRGRTYIAMLTAVAVLAVMTLVPIEIANRVSQAQLKQIEALIGDESGCFGAYAVLNSCGPTDIPTGLVAPGISATDSYTTDIPAKFCDDKRVEGQIVLSCTYPGGRDAIALFGDSHAAHIIAPLRRIAAERGQTLKAFTRTGCSGFADPEKGTTSNEQLCNQWSASTMDRLVSDESIRTVVVSVRSMLATTGDIPTAIGQFERLRAAGKSVYVVRAVPGMPDRWPINFRERAETAPKCIELHHDCDWTPPPWDDWLVDAANDAGVRVLDTWEVVCPNGICRATIGGTIVYFDESHLTLTFAKTMTPWFREQIPAD